MDPAHIALLLLTLAGDGSPRLALTAAEDLVECEASAAGVRMILTGAGYDILALRCGETPLTLSPFRHGATPEEETYRYRVTLPAGGGYTVTPLAQGDDCTPAPQADPAVYCARSSQHP